MLITFSYRDVNFCWLFLQKSSSLMFLLLLLKSKCLINFLIVWNVPYFIFTTSIRISLSFGALPYLQKNKVLKCNKKNCSQESGKRTCFGHNLRSPLRQAPAALSRHTPSWLCWVCLLAVASWIQWTPHFYVISFLQMHADASTHTETITHTHTHTKRAIWSGGIVLPLVVWALPWSRL